MATIMDETSGQGKFDMPGFNLPLNFVPPSSYPFPSALDPRLDVDRMPVITIRELMMLRLMNTITDKPGWETKVFDETITSKWKDEALSSTEYDYSSEVLNWVISELQYKADLFKRTGAVGLFCQDAVVKSDSAIPRDLQEALKKAVVPLENIPEVYKDYHPGSDGKVVDLVHPSLYPLIYGTTRVLTDSLVGLEDCTQKTGLGKCISDLSEHKYSFEDLVRRVSAAERHTSSTTAFSKKFQWLPCEVELPTSNEDVKITSYINNLHPQRHSGLYAIIEQIISRAIPLWNMTLAPLIGDDESTQICRVPFNGPTYDPDPNTMPDGDKPPQRDDELGEDYEERLWEWAADFRETHVVQPEPGTFQKPEVEISQYFDLRTMYSTRGLQIIVKLASIHLTPEKPAYEGGSWHVEGQLNEHICATALYYYDSRNITESRLGFRQHGSDEHFLDIEYEQHDHSWLGPVYGLEDDTPNIQEVGDVICKEGRLLTFPNVLQHRVHPFQLEDASKPGHRKILALFLVDPEYRIISTANVPPQQQEWWSAEVLSTGALDRFARELQQKVFAGVDGFPIALDQAKALRLELMDERKDFVVRQDRDFRDYTISLCEH